MSGAPILSGNGGPNAAWAGFGKALEQIGAVLKSHVADAGTYQYAYANLTDTIREVKRVLADQGLVMSQNVSLASHPTGDWVTVATTLIDTDTGDWVTWEPLHVRPGSDPQKMGSAITYAKRYAITALFSIPTEDDDGTQARAAIDEDNEEIRAVAARQPRAHAAKQALSRLDDDGKQVMRSAVYDEFGRQLVLSELDTDETLLVFVEALLATGAAS